MNISTNSLDQRRRNGLIGGLSLVAIGLYLLVAQFVRAEWMGMLILPGLSLIFLAWGLFTRNAGLLVPGGILGGIALGTYLTSNIFKNGMDLTQGAVFLLAFAAGWALITVLSALIGQRQLWPLARLRLAAAQTHSRPSSGSASFGPSSPAASWPPSARCCWRAARA